ncbi:MAG: RHS repeat-associated core domain-containing protein, partial [Myxococcota bacterium]|nr:RHS repeat-associated core domain-containing protein [Myxococcota bacterium]
HLYDAAGRLARVVAPDGRYVAYAYDVAGNVLEVATRGRTTRYERDGQGRITGVTDAAGGRTAYTHDARGWLAGVTLPSGATVAIERNVVGRPTRIAHRAPGGSVLLDERYERDAAGRIVRVTSGSGVTEYTYDAEGRITGERRPDGRTQEYRYDADGNLTRKGTTDLRYDARGRLVAVGGDTYAWDAAGRLVSRSVAGVGESFSYDALGRLVRIARTGASPARIDLAYDARDLLVQTTVDGEVRRLLWDVVSRPVPVALEETDAAGNVRSRITWGVGPISRSTPAGGTRWLHPDTRGSVRLETDAAGTSVGTAEYLAYGEPDGAVLDGPLGFTGEWRVPGTDLYYFRARFYEPRSGRFLTPDPVSPDLQDPRGLNPYLYVQGDPINLWDPTGQWSMSEIGAVMSIINILSTIVLAVFPDAETMVLDAFGLGNVLHRVESLVGARASFDAEGLTGPYRKLLGSQTLLGLGGSIGIDAYYNPLQAAAWLSIEPYFQVGWRGALKKPGIDFEAGPIVGKPKLVRAGWTWEAVDIEVFLTTSSQAILGKARAGKVRYQKLLQWIKCHVAELKVSWPIGGEPKLSIVGKRIAPQALWRSVTIGLKFRWTFGKIDPSGIVGPDPWRWSQRAIDWLLERLLAA